MQILSNLDITTFGEKHPLYTAKWHGRSLRSFLSWLRQEERWSVGDLHQPAQPGKVAGNPLDEMAPSTPTAPPVRLMMALLFQSMTAALMQNAFWPLSAKALIASTAAGPPLSWRTPTLLHQSWPLLVQEMSHGNSASCAELSNVPKADNNFEKLSRFIHEVCSEIQWYFLCQFSSGCPEAKGVWTRVGLPTALGRVNSYGDSAPGMMLLPKCLVDAGTSQHTLPHLDVEFRFMKCACDC